eukprot:8500355-Alexandrium_andersonii.AAC.1
MAQARARRPRDPVAGSTNPCQNARCPRAHRRAGCSGVRPLWLCKGRALCYWSPGAQLPNSDNADAGTLMERRQRLAARSIPRA